MNKKLLYIILTLASAASAIICIYTTFNLWWFLISIFVLAFAIGGLAFRKY